MEKFWTISAPREKIRHQIWETLCPATIKNNNLSTNSKFNISDQKIVTLNFLFYFLKVVLYLADALEENKMLCEKCQNRLLPSNRLLTR
uniref:V-type proton ATPase subunit C n=1 Tax=Anolis carolinensis TaxID=28377 RepID=A0A803T960_ANOCA